MNPNRTNIPREMPLMKPSSQLEYIPPLAGRSGTARVVQQATPAWLPNSKCEGTSTHRRGSNAPLKKYEIVEYCTEAQGTALQNVENTMGNLERQVGELIDEFYTSTAVFQTQTRNLHRLLRVMEATNKTRSSIVTEKTIEN